MRHSSSLATPHYSIQPRDWILAKNYEFLTFSENMVKHISEKISKNVSGKYIQKIPKEISKRSFISRKPLVI